MRILLYDAIDCWMLGGREDLADLEQVLPPIGLMSLATYVKDKLEDQVEFKILSGVVDCKTMDEFRKEIEEFKPQLVGIRGLNIFANKFHEAARTVKSIDPNIYVFGGGPYSTSTAREAFEDTSIDFWAIGEGEEIFLQSIEEIMKGKSPKNVKGLVYNEEGKIKQNSPMPYLNDLDSLPWPDYNFIDVEKYSQYITYGYNRRRPGIIFSSRGCPFHCVYCHVEFGKKFRQRSSENLFGEVLNLYQSKGIKDFYIVDDIFNLNYRRSMEFFDRIIESGIKVRLYFPNGLRGDMVDKKYVDKMVEAGTIFVSYAIETATPRLQKMIKKHVNLKKLQDTIHYTSSKNIIVNVFTMFGFPTETAQECMDTIEYVKQFKNITIPYFFAVKNYPGTEVRDISVTYGHDVETMRDAYSDVFHNIGNSQTPLIPREEFQKIYFTFMKEVFMDNERLENSYKIMQQFYSEDEILSMYSTFFRKRLNNFKEDVLEWGASATP